VSLDPFLQDREKIAPMAVPLEPGAEGADTYGTVLFLFLTHFQVPIPHPRRAV